MVTKIGLVEWLKVKALSSNPSTAKTNNNKKTTVHTTGARTGGAVLDKDPGCPWGGSCLNPEAGQSEEPGGARGQRPASTEV
jgi:hypothetical protein